MRSASTSGPNLLLQGVKRPLHLLDCIALEALRIVQDVADRIRLFIAAIGKICTLFGEVGFRVVMIAFCVPPMKRRIGSRMSAFRSSRSSSC